jgi:hypothetical protein
LLPGPQNKGHADLRHFEPDEVKAWGFAGPIATLEQLVYVLTTIAWTTSGHHAAVNFGQYDFGAFMLNISSLIRRPIPRPGDEEDKAYQVGQHGVGGAASAVSLLLTKTCPSFGYPTTDSWCFVGHVDPGGGFRSLPVPKQGRP